MSVSIEEVRRVAQLARLEINDAELSRLAEQLSAILNYVDQLRQVPTTGVEPLAHPLPIQNIFRADEIATSLPVGDALANAPDQVLDLDTSGGFFKVPPVFE